ncbi:MAG: citrate lyase acyl carrier protein [Clostridiales bacterium]|nr:citrate lyase acyl carrier protein [Clostridiales bacterium]
MIIQRNAVSGTESPGDLTVRVEPSDALLDIYVQSKVDYLFLDSIRKAVKDTAESLQVHNATIMINDFGALDYVIRARVETALRRAGGGN